MCTVLSCFFENKQLCNYTAIVPQFLLPYKNVHFAPLKIHKLLRLGGTTPFLSDEMQQKVNVAN